MAEASQSMGLDACCEENGIAFGDIHGNRKTITLSPSVEKFNYCICLSIKKL
jgi:hypothetical protein